MFIEIIKFIVYSALIVVIAKYILVPILRRLAEALNLKAKTIGNIAGYATSIPELLTITTSSLTGLMNASIFNIISSNVINLIQYIAAIILNKNLDKFKNKYIKVNLILVLFTIIIPIVLLVFNIELNISIVPAFIILYILFRFINSHTHKIYLKKEDELIEKELEEDIIKEKQAKIKNKFVGLKYAFYLLLVGILLFFIGDALGNTLENLCRRFNISEIIIGILLGFITSIPELMTFFESQKHYKKQNDDMLGVVEATNNLITSNILNLFLIQSLGILIFNFIK